jgi:transcriptional regulator NrdR family protein
MYCSFCGSKNHIIDNCPKTWGGQANRNKMRCSYCGSRQHNIIACPKTFQGNGNMSPWNKHKYEKDYIED